MELLHTDPSYTTVGGAMRVVLEITELADDNAYYGPEMSHSIANTFAMLEAAGYGIIPKRGDIELSEPFNIIDGGKVVDTGRNVKSVTLYFRVPEEFGPRTISVTITDEK